MSLLVKIYWKCEVVGKETVDVDHEVEEKTELISRSENMSAHVCAALQMFFPFTLPGACGVSCAEHA